MRVIYARMNRDDRSRRTVRHGRRRSGREGRRRRRNGARAVRTARASRYVRDGHGRRRAGIGMRSGGVRGVAADGTGRRWPPGAVVHGQEGYAAVRSERRARAGGVDGPGRRAPVEGGVLARITGARATRETCIVCTRIYISYVLHTPYLLLLRTVGVRGVPTGRRKRIADLLVQHVKTHVRPLTGSGRIARASVRR